MVKGKTLIVVAHRLSTIEDADKIVVIDSGNIVGEGTQNELLMSCSVYARMWQENKEALSEGKGGGACV